MRFWVLTVQSNLRLGAQKMCVTQILEPGGSVAELLDWIGCFSSSQPYRIEKSLPHLRWM